MKSFVIWSPGALGQCINKIDSGFVLLCRNAAKVNEVLASLFGNLSQLRQHSMLNTPSERAATQQECFDNNGVHCRREDYYCDHAIVAKAVVQVDNQAFPRFIFEDLPDFRLRLSCST